MLEFSLLERAAIQHTPAFATSRDGTIEFVNEQYCVLRGVSAEQLLGSALPWMSRLAAAASVPPDRALWQGELPPDSGKGLQGTVVPRTTAAGELAGFLCLASPQPLPAATLGAPVDADLIGIFLTSAEGNPLFISNELSARYQQLPEELCGLEAPVCSLEQWRHSPNTGWRSWLRGSAPRFSAELELTTRAGSTEKLEQRATRLQVGEQCLGIVGTLSLRKTTTAQVHELRAPGGAPCLQDLLEQLLSHAARFAQDLLQGGRLHDLREVDHFLQGLTAVALAAPMGHLAASQPAAPPSSQREQVA